MAAPLRIPVEPAADSAVTAARPRAPGDRLVDSFGRVHRDLRISVTDRCNFRCTYCMPAEGMQWLPREQLLTYEELSRVAGVLVGQLGISSIRLTGGEPTLRARLPVLVARLAALRTPTGAPVDVALTTNGSTLAHEAHDLAAAGLRRINVSLDSLRRDRFLAVTRRDGLAAVLEGIDAAVAAGLDPVKLNVVVVRGVNDDELVDLAAFGRDRGVTVRFIEFMPLDAQHEWTLHQVVTRDEILAAVGAAFPLEPAEPAAADRSAPAQRWRFVDGRGEIGVIPTVSHAFCATCDRVRLSAEGAVRSCLFALDEHDLRGPLRAGASDDDLAAIVEAAVAAKWAGHRIDQPVFVRPPRSMSQIGG
jgi:cyclic pyranopterin phosphate synthase